MHISTTTNNTVLKIAKSAMLSFMLLIGILLTSCSGGDSSSRSASSSADQTATKTECKNMSAIQAKGTGWCKCCDAGFVDGKPVKCKGCYMVKTGQADSCSGCEAKKQGCKDCKDPSTCKTCVKGANAGKNPAQKSACLDCTATQKCKKCKKT